MIGVLLSLLASYLSIFDLKQLASTNKEWRFFTMKQLLLKYKITLKDAPDDFVKKYGRYLRNATVLKKIPDQNVFKNIVKLKLLDIPGISKIDLTLCKKLQDLTTSINVITNAKKVCLYYPASFIKLANNLRKLKLITKSFEDSLYLSDDYNYYFADCIESCPNIYNLHVHNSYRKGIISIPYTCLVVKVGIYFNIKLSHKLKKLTSSNMVFKHLRPIEIGYWKMFMHYPATPMWQNVKVDKLKILRIHCNYMSTGSKINVIEHVKLVDNYKYLPFDNYPPVVELCFGAVLHQDYPWDCIKTLILNKINVAQLRYSLHVFTNLEKLIVVNCKKIYIRICLFNIYPKKLSQIEIINSKAIIEDIKKFSTITVNRNSTHK